MSLWKKLGSHTVVYGLSSILGRLINWALTPLYANYFTREEFGIFSDLYALTFYPLIVLTFGMETSFFHFAGKKADFEKTYAHAFMVVAVMNVFFLLTTVPGYGPLAEVLGYGNHPLPLLLLVMIIAADTLAALPMARLRYLEKSRRFVVISLSNIFITLILNILFITVFQWGTDSVWYANLTASVIKLLLAFGGNVPKWIRPEREILKPMFWYGFYIMLAGLAGAINETLDRNLLPRLWGPEKKMLFGAMYTGLELNGIYSVMYKLGMFISLITQAFRYAAEPFFFRQASEADAPQTYAKIFHYFTTLCLLTFLLIAGTAKEIVSFDFFGYADFTLIPERYWVGLEAIPIILAANLCLAMYTNLSVWFKVTARLRYGLFISGLGAILTVVLNALTIPYLGYYGSAWSTLACYGSMCIFCYFLGKKYYPIPYRWGRLGQNAGLVLIFYLLIRFLDAKGLSGTNITLFKLFLCFTCAFGILMYEKYVPVFSGVKGSESGN